MSLILKDLFHDLENQKKKYQEKIMSFDAEFTLFLRFLDIYDLMLDWGWFTIPQIDYLSIITSLIFDIDLEEIEPIKFEFDWRFPTPEEWEKGVNIVIIKYKPPYPRRVEDFLKEEIKKEYQETIEGTRPKKGRYGITKYGYSYYDPQAVREFLRNFITYTFKKYPYRFYKEYIDEYILRYERALGLPPKKKPPLFASRDELIKTMGEAVKVNPFIPLFLITRFSIIASTFMECFTLGYSVLNFSKLCRTGSKGVVPALTHEGKLAEFEGKYLSHMMWGFILNYTPLGFGLLIPKDDLFALPERRLTPEYAVEGSPDFTYFVYDRVLRFRSRIFISPMAISNYAKPEERMDYSKSDRVTIWGTLMGLRYTLEYLVLNYLGKVAPAMPQFDKRKYVSAVLQLLGHLGKRHKWGYNIFKYLTSEELRDWWLRYWEEKGLDINILSKLFDMVKVWLPPIVRQKVELGKKLRLQRLGIPLE